MMEKNLKVISLMIVTGVIEKSIKIEQKISKILSAEIILKQILIEFIFLITKVVTSSQGGNCGKLTNYKFDICMSDPLFRAVFCHVHVLVTLEQYSVSDPSSVSIYDNFQRAWLKC